ncbi:MAG: hypothetical protein WCI27_02655, partial [Candidatus Omnitrophota bacterium]
MRAFRFIIILFVSLVMCVGVSVAFMLFTTNGAERLVRFAVKSVFGSEDVVFERLEGSLKSGVRIFNLESRRLFLLPDAGKIRV